MVYHDIHADSGKKANAGKETPALTFTSKEEAWIMYQYFPVLTIACLFQRLLPSMIGIFGFRSLTHL